MPMILAGIQSVIWSLGIKRALFCIKEHTAERLSLSEGDTLGAHITVKVMPNVYPIGDEVSLIYQATGRIIRPGNLPISKGVLVYNVETMYNLGRAIKFFEPVTMKWLTVGGDVKEPLVVRVPIGISVADLFERLGIEVDSDHAVIDGGPSMGKIINHNIAEVGKTTKALLVLPKNSKAIESKLINKKMAVTRAETACCQCTRCTDMCPRALLGYPLEPHKMVRTAKSAVSIMPEMVLSATLCCGCGVCESLACSQGISPRAVINEYKGLLAKNKLRYLGKEEVEHAVGVVAIGWWAKQHVDGAVGTRLHDAGRRVVLGLVRIQSHALLHEVRGKVARA
jgi:Na+-translocating ferredoxin:NAD+ oxidoreductase RnfC subunit